MTRFNHQITENLAFGYGMAWTAIRQSRIVAAILARILVSLNERDIDDEDEGDRFNAESTFVVEEDGWVESYDYDWDREDAVRHHKVYRSTLRGIVEKAVELAWEYGDNLDEVNNLVSLEARLFGDDDNVYATIRTEAEQKKAEMEERRKRLESVAAAFAASCGHAVGTREFVKAAKDRLAEVRDGLDHWNGGENQMEHWAACMHAGCRDSFWSDNDFVRGRFAEALDGLDEVLDYMRDAFPLLMLHIEREED